MREWPRHGAVGAVRRVSDRDQGWGRVSGAGGTVLPLVEVAGRPRLGLVGVAGKAALTFRGVRVAVTVYTAQNGWAKTKMFLIQGCSTRSLLISDSFGYSHRCFLTEKDSIDK